MRLLPLSIALAMGLTGCVGGRSPDARYYQLQPQSSPPAQAVSLDDSLFVVVKPVILEAYLRQPRMVERVAPHEVVYREYARWAEPLDQNITRVITENLRRLLKTDRVALVSQAIANERAIVLLLEITQLERMPDGVCRLKAGWIVQGESSAGAAAVGTAEISLPSVGNSPEEQASAHSALLADLCARIASAIMTQPRDATTSSVAQP